MGMSMTPWPSNVGLVTGTTKECSLNGCDRPARKDRLCVPHILHRALFTLLQLGGLTAFTIAGFMVATWLGVALLAVSLVLIGLALEGM